MDEVFWSNVLKRWSDASENVIILKKELVKVHEERELYRGLVDSLRKIDVRESHQSTEGESLLHNHTRINSLLNNERDGSTVTDELQDAEVGLNKAKEEYRRLQQGLASSIEEIKALRLENDRLTIERGQQISELQAELADTKNICRRQGKELQKCEATEKTAANFEGSSKPAFGSPSQKGKTPEKEFEDLKRTLEATQMENHNLREELANTRDKLQKAEDSSKALLSSIIKLQTITRHSTPTAPLSWSINPLRPNSRGSSRKLSFSSIGQSKNSISIEHRRALQDATPHINDNTIVRESISQFHFVLPLERQKILVELPLVPVPEVDTKQNAFDRDFLKAALSDGMQSLIKYLPKDRIDKTIVSSYLCPTLNHHPWCPSSPGQHGFLFVGLGKERNSYKSPVIRNLFVGLPKGPTMTRMFRYLGRYKVSRVEPLAVEEWLSLSTDVKSTYVKLTKDKAKDTRTPEDILQAYDKGDLLVPCVLLQYMGFDDPFHAGLLSYMKAANNLNKD